MEQEGREGVSVATRIDSVLGPGVMGACGSKRVASAGESASDLILSVERLEPAADEHGYTTACYT